MILINSFFRNIDWFFNIGIKKIEGINLTVNVIKGLLYNGGLIYVFLYFVIVMFVELML